MLVQIKQGSLYDKIPATLRGIRKYQEPWPDDGYSRAWMRGQEVAPGPGGVCTWEVKRSGLYTIRTEPDISIWFAARRTAGRELDKRWISSYQAHRIIELVCDGNSYQIAAHLTLDRLPTVKERSLAISVSVMHWNDVRKQIETNEVLYAGLDRGERLLDLLGFRVTAQMCPLCSIYWESTCEGCPLNSCHYLSSLWHAVALTNGTAASTIMAIDRMLAKLRIPSERKQASSLDERGWAPPY